MFSPAFLSKLHSNGSAGLLMKILHSGLSETVFVLLTYPCSQERPGNTISREWRQVDARWTWGGGGARLQVCAQYNLRARFLQVKRSICNLVNVWGLAYRWSAQWWSLVHYFMYLNVDPPMSTSRPPDVIHVIHVPGLPHFRRSSISMYYTECKLKNKNGGDLGTRLLLTLRLFTPNTIPCKSYPLNQCDNIGYCSNHFKVTNWNYLVLSEYSLCIIMGSVFHPPCNQQQSLIEKLNLA